MWTQAQWYTILAEFLAYSTQAQINAGTSSDLALYINYYDGELCRYRMADYTLDTTTYYAQADVNNAVYTHYGRNNTPSQQFTLPGYMAFGGGLAERYDRRADSDALTDLHNLIAHSAYHAYGGSLSSTPSLRHELSREWAYCILNMLACKRVDSINGTEQTRLEQCYADSLIIVDDWITETASYYAPFMGGITAHALIDYYELEADASEKATILAALEDLAAYTDSECWDDASQSFFYYNKYVEGSGDRTPAPTLNMLIAPLYSWLWSVTATESYKTRGEEIFQGAYPVYSGPWYQSGADLGNRDVTNTSGKQIHQQIIWGAKYFEYAGAEAPPPSEPIPTLSAMGSRMLLLGCGGGQKLGAGYVAQIATPATMALSGNNPAVSGFDATSYGTVRAWIDFTQADKVLDSLGAQADNNDPIATVTDRMGTWDATQSDNSYRPLVKTGAINGYQSSVWDGSHTFMILPNAFAKNLGKICAIVVYKQTNHSAERGLMRLKAGSEDAFTAYHQSGGYYRLYAESSSGTGAELSYNSAVPTGTWLVEAWDADYAGNTIQLRDSTGQLATRAGDGGSATANSDASNNIVIGDEGVYGSYPFLGEIAQVIFYTAITNANIDACISALRSRYGL